MQRNLFSIKLLKVGHSRFLRDHDCRHDTGLEISISRSGLIAIQFNYRIVSPIFDINHIYLSSYSTIFDKNHVYLSSIYCLIR